MPWTPEDAPKHNKSTAGIPARQRQWAAVANAELARTGDEAIALRAANSAVKHHPAEMAEYVARKGTKS
jgi:hypothetical protein